MTVEQKRKVLIKIQTLEKDIDELKRCRLEIASNGYASATMSSGGGSKSYTRLNLNDLNTAINTLTKELKQYRQMLTDGNNGASGFKTIYTIY